MKQFRVMNPSTYAWRSVDEGELMSMMSTATDSLLARWVPVGNGFTDSDGFQVERDADTGPGSVDLRLERIATAAMVPGITAAMQSPEMTAELLSVAGKNGTTLPAMVAVDAVAFAKALIAELDKQA
jgi:hypothetical protein